MGLKKTIKRAVRKVYQAPVKAVKKVGQTLGIVARKKAYEGGMDEAVEPTAPPPNPHIDPTTGLPYLTSRQAGYGIVRYTTDKKPPLV